MSHREIEIQVEGVNCEGSGSIPRLVMMDTNLSLIAKCVYAYFCSYAGGGIDNLPHPTTACEHLSISYDEFLKAAKELFHHNYWLKKRYQFPDGTIRSKLEINQLPQTRKNPLDIIKVG